MLTAAGRAARDDAGTLAVDAGCCDDSMTVCSC